MIEAPYPWLADLRGVERVRETDVPGLVIVQYRKSGKHPRCYVVTHAGSGKALTQTHNRPGGARYLKLATAVVAKLGEARYRRRPVDWMLPADELLAIPAARDAMAFVNGWIFFGRRGTPSIEEQVRLHREWRASIGFPVPESSVTPRTVFAA